MIEIECKDSYDYNNGYDYGRYLLCFQNPTLFLAITKEGPDKVLAPFEPPSPEVAAKIPPKVRRVRYNIYGEEEEDDEDD